MYFLTPVLPPPPSHSLPMIKLLDYTVPGCEFLRVETGFFSPFAWLAKVFMLPQLNLRLSWEAWGWKQQPDILPVGKTPSRLVRPVYPRQHRALTETCAQVVAALLQDCGCSPRRGTASSRFTRGDSQNVVLVLAQWVKWLCIVVPPTMPPQWAGLFK